MNSIGVEVSFYNTKKLHLLSPNQYEMSSVLTKITYVS